MNKAQEFIRKKRRKKRIKRLSIASVISIIAIILFIYKAPIFNVKEISFTGVTTVNEEELEGMLNEYIGKNIFTINYKEISEKILENPYIKNVEVDKNGNSALEVKIEEGKVVYYIREDETYKAITNDGFYVERLETIEGRNLVNVIGVKDNGKEVGQKIIDDEKVIKVLNDFNPILKSSVSELRVESLDVSDIFNIKGYISGVQILFGSNEDLVEKMNKVLNILEQNTMEKEAIDIRFKDQPVIKVKS